MEVVLEIIKYTLPALVVALVVFLMLKSDRDSTYQLKVLELKSKNSKEFLPLKLQAYERLTLFMHRTSPENIIARLTTASMTSTQLKNRLIQTLQEEYEHNITQQIYVSNNIWNALSAYKKLLTKIILDKHAKLGEGKTAYDLGKLILEEYHSNDELLSANQVNEVIKTELKTLFV